MGAIDPTQLTIDGDEIRLVAAPRGPAPTQGEPRPRSVKPARLFDAPQTIAGQLDFSQGALTDAAQSG